MPKGKKMRKWSTTYKKSIHCNRPKGFSQKQYCKYGRNTKKVIHHGSKLILSKIKSKRAHV